MIAVDTNVLVRLIVADDAVQGKRAAKLFAQSAGVFVAKTVVLETAWVLQSAYGFSRHDVAGALRRLAGLPNVASRMPSRWLSPLIWSRAMSISRTLFTLPPVAKPEHSTRSIGD